MVVLVDTVSANQVRPRHPEKVNRPDALSPPKPDWIRVRAPNTRGYADTRKIVKENGLVTVCEEAGCPNIGECWDKKHATFMIMGDTCTRACGFCNVKTGMPGALDAAEPEHVAEATFKLGPTHAVVTLVDRDDLADGGAEHFGEAIRAIRAACPTTTIEILTPDFLRKEGALEVVAAAKPDVFNDNLETVAARDPSVRPGARYLHFDPAVAAGQGDRSHHLHQIRHHGRPRRGAPRGAAGDGRWRRPRSIPTIGQDLQPTCKHHAVMRYVTPDEFAGYEKVADTKDVLMVSASPRRVPRTMRARILPARRRASHGPASVGSNQCNGFSSWDRRDPASRHCSTAVGNDGPSLVSLDALDWSRGWVAFRTPSPDSAWPRSHASRKGHGR